MTKINRIRGQHMTSEPSDADIYARSSHPPPDHDDEHQPMSQREFDALMAYTRNREIAQPIQQSTDTQPMQNQLNIRQLIDSARSELGYSDHYANGQELPTARLSKTPAAGGALSLRQLIPAVPNDYKNRYPGVVSRSPGETRTLQADILMNSRVAQAGAQIVVMQSAPVAVNNGVPVFFQRNHDFRIVKPADFALILDGADVVSSPYPVISSYDMLGWETPMGDAPSAAVSFTISRKDQKRITDDQLEFEIMQSISHGLARAADWMLVAEIMRGHPALFTIGAAAAKNLKWPGLRALIGSDALSESTSCVRVRQDGQLTAYGIPAELTDVTEGVVVGAFENSAVFISDDIRLIFKRNSVYGDLDVTAFANMFASVPDPGMFWLGATAIA
jgi:hypothetical protein